MKLDLPRRAGDTADRRAPRSYARRHRHPHLRRHRRGHRVAGAERRNRGHVGDAGPTARPGAVIGLYFHLRGVALALATVFGSAAALVLISLPMAWFGWWHVRAGGHRAPARHLQLRGRHHVWRRTAHRSGAAPEIAHRIRQWTFGPGGLATIGFALALASAKHGLPSSGEPSPPRVPSAGSACCSSSAPSPGPSAEAAAGRDGPWCC